jgi:hypothetical protein
MRAALEEPRRHQLDKELGRVASIQTMNKDQQRQNQLKIRRERAQLRRKSETARQRQARLENERERVQSNRLNETEEQRQVRVDQQRKRTIENRKKTKISPHKFCATNRDQQGIKMQDFAREVNVSYVLITID